MTRYPRDFRGHGPNAPDAAWPGGAKIAVSVVLNYEEGGENNILHGDAGSEAFLSDIAGAAPWPGQRHWNMESIYDYGARAGFWRLHRLFTGLAIPVTIYGVATALARNPEQVAAMKAAGWEIASHGLKWVDHRDMPRGRARPDRRGHPPAYRSGGHAPARLVHRPLLGQHRRSDRRNRGRSTGFPTPMTTTCPTGARSATATSWSSPTRSRPTTCALPPRRATPRASSSSHT